MESFLLDKGETIIRSIEAGSRTSMMHHMGSGNPLHTLLSESSRDEEIVFIEITRKDGSVLDQAGFPSTMHFSESEMSLMLSTGQAMGKLDANSGIYVIAKVFQARHSHQMMGVAGDMPRGRRTGYGNGQEQIISIGLLTRRFDEAREQDVHHALFMGAILFLVGSAGLYLLFLYQGMRVARSTLSDMKLYTDSVIESIPVSLLTVDAQDRVVSCNRNTEALLGCSLENIRGRVITDTLPACPVCISDICNDSFDHPTEIYPSESPPIPVRISCSSLINHEGETIGKVIIIRDMSSLRDMELQLERSRRMAALGKMAAGIAHEIRNPLGTLRGFAQFFGTRATDPEEKEYSDLMVSEVDRLNQTVSGLLQFARPREPQLAIFALDDLIRKVATLMKADIEARGLDFSCRQESGIEIVADQDLLLQVLMNLIKNSTSASDKGGSIVLVTAQDTHSVRITVKDDGRGMDEREREKMFDPFFTTTKTGTGLGLAVSHQIVEQHGGTFEVTTSPGEGTSITVVLPK